MNKKLLTTSALAGIVALTGTSFAETKVGGNLEYVFNSASATTAANSSSGSGFEENINISNSKDTDFGTLSFGFNLENAGTEGANMTLKSDATTFQIGADSAPNLSASVVPNTGESYKTVAAGVGTLAYTSSFSMGAGDAIKRKNAVGFHLGQDVAGGNLSIRYVPNSDQDLVSATGDTGRDGTSSIRILYNGSLGVEGLKVMAGWAEDEKSAANTADGKAKTLGASYNFGQISVGAQRRIYEPTAAIASQNEYKTNEYGIGYAVNDNLTVALTHVVTDGDLLGVDFPSKEKITGIGIGYNLGGIALELSYADVSDANGVSGSDGEAFQLKTIQKF